MKMDDLELDWFIREEVESGIETNLMPIAESLVEDEVDYTNDFEEICKYLKRGWPSFVDFTAEEFTYVLEHLATQCSLISMTKKGLLKETEPGTYALTDMGKLAQEKLIERD